MQRAKLLFRFLQIAIADVLPDCVTEDVFERVLERDVFRAGADHDRELGLEISFVFGESDSNRAFVRRAESWAL